MQLFIAEIHESFHKIGHNFKKRLLEIQELASWLYVHVARLK